MRRIRFFVIVAMIDVALFSWVMSTPIPSKKKQTDVHGLRDPSTIPYARRKSCGRNGFGQCIN